MADWLKYAVTSLGANAQTSDRGLTFFEVVGHTSHVDSAINILIDGGIKPGLVFDKSQLNTSRIQVGWLSPNHWHPGYRYGNVKFKFKFSDLIRYKNFYWVEAITVYSPPACRILITDQDRSSQLKIYDPTLRTGPWWYDQENDEHFYNNHYCLEFMFEDKIPLEKIAGFEFVDHHRSYCSVHRNDPAQCDQLGDRAAIGGAKFLMKAMARALDVSKISNYFFYMADYFDFNFLSAVSEIPRLITVHCNFGGPVTPYSPHRVGLARAALNAIVCERLQEASEIVNLFGDEEIFRDSLAEVVLDTVGSGSLRTLKTTLS